METFNVRTSAGHAAPFSSGNDYMGMTSGSLYQSAPTNWHEPVTHAATNGRLHSIMVDKCGNLYLVLFSLIFIIYPGHLLSPNKLAFLGPVFQGSSQIKILKKRERENKVSVLYRN